MIKLSPVSLRIGERIQCSQCFKMSTPVYADLKGKAFQSYYCDACAKPHLIVSHRNRGTGGEITFTGPDEEAVTEAAKQSKAGIDYMRSPSLTIATPTSDGRWQAVVRYFGLD